MLKRICYYPVKEMSTHACSSLGFNDPLSDTFYERLIKSFHISNDIFERSCKMEYDDIWNKGFLSDARKDIHQALIAEKRVDVWRKILSDPSKHNLFYGFDSHNKELFHLYDPQQYTADVLFRLYEAVGGKLIWNPEAEAEFSPPEIEELMKPLKDLTPSLLAFPAPYSGMQGIFTSNGLVMVRALWGLYLAWRASQYAPQKVMEIGAGLGYAAYFSRLFNVAEYTIVDIPLTLVASSHFLALTQGENCLQLCYEDSTPRLSKTMYSSVIGRLKRVLLGDDVRRPAANPNASVQHTFYKMKSPVNYADDNSRYDIILNMDSLPEVGHETAKNYAEYISTHAKRFISINHEYSDCITNELFRNNPHVRSHTRYPFWLRKGYVEEIYEFAP